MTTITERSTHKIRAHGHTRLYIETLSIGLLLYICIGIRHTYMHQTSKHRLTIFSANLHKLTTQMPRGRPQTNGCTETHRHTDMYTHTIQYNWTFISRFNKNKSCTTARYATFLVIVQGEYVGFQFWLNLGNRCALTNRSMKAVPFYLCM